MIRLRKILLCNYLYYIFLLFVILFSIIRINAIHRSNYTSKSNKFIGIITNIKIDGDLLQFTLKDKNNEMVKANYFFKNLKEKNKYQYFFKLGDKIELKAKFIKITKTTTKNIFNYQEYAMRKNMFYNLEINTIIKISDNNNFVYFFKNFIYDYFNNFKNSKYLKLLLLGDKTYIDEEIISSFRENGISHLFAISGMHVGIITSLILNILNAFKIREEKRYLIVSIFLFIYLFLVGSSASIMRAFLFFVLISINKIYYFYIDNIYLFILTFSITLLINPFYIYDVGFQYSFLISFTLILSSNILNKCNSYFINLFFTSSISFFSSLPITLYHFNQINLLSIFYNLFFVPLVTLLLFPLSIIILILPFLGFIYNFLILVLEKSSLFLSSIDTFKFIFGKINISFYFIYYILFFMFLKYYKKIFLIIFFLILIFHYFFYSIFDSDYLVMLDIGQGDSFIMHSKNKTIMIDTGGKVVYTSKKWAKKSKSSIVSNITIPYLKSKGIKKIDFLVLTHGDLDHLGEAVNLINNYKVKKVFINEGKINNLEKEIINTADDVEVCYQNTYFEVGEFKFYSLNKDLKDENSSSIVLYILYKNLQMLFMGDANFKSENYLINNYNLNKIDILKVGHHGSKSSSSIDFLKRIRPSIALISAGKDNKFNHPNKEVIERLNMYNVKYYSTKDIGTVEFILSR